MSNTFAMLKPDALENELVDEIINRLESDGFKVIEKELVIADEDKILEHYKDVIELRGESFLTATLNSFLGKKVIILKLSRSNAINRLREIIGDTEPIKANKGTIRGGLSNDSFKLANEENRMVNNLIHASDSKENFLKEVNLWFTQK